MEQNTDFITAEATWWKQGWLELDKTTDVRIFAWRCDFGAPERGRNFKNMVSEEHTFFVVASERWACFKIPMNCFKLYFSRRRWDSFGFNERHGKVFAAIQASKLRSLYHVIVQFNTLKSSCGFGSSWSEWYISNSGCPNTYGLREISNASRKTNWAASCWRSLLLPL